MSPGPHGSVLTVSVQCEKKHCSIRNKDITPVIGSGVWDVNRKGWLNGNMVQWTYMQWVLGGYAAAQTARVVGGGAGKTREG